MDSKTQALLELKILESKQNGLIEKLLSYGSNDTTRKQLAFDNIKENYRKIKHLKIMYQI